MQIGFDFGGSLIKLSISFLECNSLEHLLLPVRERITHEFSKSSRKYVNVLYKREELNDFIEYLNFIHPHLRQPFVVCTGGGVCDKRTQLQDALIDIELEPLAEFKSIVEGVEYFSKIIPNFIYTLDEGLNKVPLDFHQLHPFLLANIGTGISINQVNKNGSSYLCGTSMGGTSLLGFAQLFDKNPDFEQLLESFNSMDTDSEEDWVFERGYESYMDDKPGPPLSLSLFQGIIVNICNISYLVAKRQGISHVVFIGNFMKGNSLARKLIQKEIKKLCAVWGHTVLVN